MQSTHTGRYTYPGRPVVSPLSRRNLLTLRTRPESPARLVILVTLESLPRLATLLRSPGIVVVTIKAILCPIRILAIPHILGSLTQEISILHIIAKLARPVSWPILTPDGLPREGAKFGKGG